MDNPAYNREDTEEDQEAGDAVDDVVHLHPAGSIEALADLDGECQNKNDCGDVEERNDHGMAGSGKPQEDRMQDQNHGDSEAADNDEVKLFVSETVLTLIVQGQEIRVDPGDQHDDVVQQCFHNDSFVFFLQRQASL